MAANDVVSNSTTKAKAEEKGGTEHSVVYACTAFRRSLGCKMSLQKRQQTSKEAPRSQTNCMVVSKTSSNS